MAAQCVNAFVANGSVGNLFGISLLKGSAKNRQYIRAAKESALKTKNTKSAKPENAFDLNADQRSIPVAAAIDFGIDAIKSESTIAKTGISFGSTHTILISLSSSVIT